jgi:hypothetical protein
MNPSTSARVTVRYGVMSVLAIAAVTLAALHAADAPSAGAAVNASGEQPTRGNWNFETGDFQGWRTTHTGSGAWHVYSDATTPPNPADSDPNFPFSVPRPPEGRFAAVTDMSAPGTRMLYRDVKPGDHAALRMTVFYVNVGPFASPPTLQFRTHKPNQQFRVDLMDPAAPVASLARKHILATIFRTVPGDPDTLDPKTITLDLSRWANKKVRIRLAQVDNRGPLRAGVDDVRLQPTAP